MSEVKKYRSGRASLQQYNEMLTFFESEKGFAEGKFLSINGRDENKKKWLELAQKLNNLNGATKTPEQWQVVWRDLKSRVSKRAREIRKQRLATGNMPVSVMPLNELELRVLHFMGTAYVEGSDQCADSIPEEEDAIMQLEAGQTDCLLKEPSVCSIFNDKEAYTEVVTEDDNLIVIDPAELAPINRKRKVEGNIEGDIQKKRTRAAGEKAKKTLYDKRDLLANKFQTIADKQADALAVLANAFKLQAEAAHLQATATENLTLAVENVGNAMREQTKINEMLLKTFHGK